MSYEDSWEKMNNLNDTITDMVFVKNLLIEYNKNKNDEVLRSIITVFDLCINKQDSAFSEAWKETIIKFKEEQTEKIDKNNYKYTDEELNSMCENAQKEMNKKNKWTLPVEIDALSGEYYILFPEEILDKVGWEEGEELNWIERPDGSFILKRVLKEVKEDEC